MRGAAEVNYSTDEIWLGWTTIGKWDRDLVPFVI